MIKESHEYYKCKECKGKGNIRTGGSSEPDAIICPTCSGLGHTDAFSMEYLGCGTQSCLLEKPKGQGVNGPCTCLANIPTSRRLRIEKWIRRVKNETTL